MMRSYHYQQKGCLGMIGNPLYVSQNDENFTNHQFTKEISHSNVQFVTTDVLKKSDLKYHILSVHEGNEIFVTIAVLKNVI